MTRCAYLLFARSSLQTGAPEFPRTAHVGRVAMINSIPLLSVLGTHHSSDLFGAVGRLSSEQTS